MKGKKWTSGTGFNIGDLITSGDKTKLDLKIGVPQPDVKSDEALLILTAQDISEAERAASHEVFKRAMNDARLVLGAGLMRTITFGDGSLENEGGGRDFTEEEIAFMEKRGYYHSNETLKLGLPMFLSELENIQANYKVDTEIAEIGVRDLLLNRYKIFDADVPEDILSLKIKSFTELLGNLTEAEIAELKRKVETGDLTAEDVAGLAKTTLETPIDLVAFLGVARFGAAKDIIVAGRAAEYYIDYMNAVRDGDSTKAGVILLEATDLYRESEPLLAKMLEEFMTDFAKPEALEEYGKDAIVASPERIYDVLDNSPDRIDKAQASKVFDLVRETFEIGNHPNVRKHRDAVTKALDGKKTFRKGEKDVLEGLTKVLQYTMRVLSDSRVEMSELVELRDATRKLDEASKQDDDKKYTETRVNQIFSIRGVELRMDKMSQATEGILQEILKKQKEVTDAISAEKSKEPVRGFNSAQMKKDEEDKTTIQAYESLRMWAENCTKLMRGMQTRSSDLGKELEKGMDIPTLAMVSVARILSGTRKALETLSKKAEIIEPILERKTAARAPE